MDLFVVFRIKPHDELIKFLISNMKGLINANSGSYDLRTVSNCALSISTFVDQDILRDLVELIVREGFKAALREGSDENHAILAEAIAPMADILDEQAARRTVELAMEKVDLNLRPHALRSAAYVIATLSSKIEPKRVQLYSRQIIDQLEKIAEQSSYFPFAEIAESVTDLAKNVNQIQLQRVACLTFCNAFKRVEQSLQPDDFYRAVDSVINVSRLVASYAMIFGCVELLKLPLAGEKRALRLLLEGVTEVTDRGSLLASQSDFPDAPAQSFWAVMQHLAELKAANPNWDWLDLARPPLPPEEIIATFRRLCADPPDWPAARHP